MKKTQNNKSKHLVILYTSLFVLGCLLVLVGYLYIKNIFFTSSKTPSPAISILTTQNEPNKSFDELNNSAISNKLDSQNIYSDKEISDLKDQINQLRNSISYQKLNNKNSLEESYKLLYKIKTDVDFSAQLDKALDANKNPYIKDLLLVLKEYSQGVQTQQQLLESFDSIYQEIYLNYLLKEKSIWSKVQYALNSLVFIKKDFTLIVDSKDIQDILNNISIYLKQNKLNEAHQEIKQLKGYYSTKTQQWIKSLSDRKELNIIISKLENSLNINQHKREN